MHAFAIEIRDDMEIAARIVGNLPRRVVGPEFFRLRLEPVPDDGTRKALDQSKQLPLKIYEGDVTIFRIAFVTVRHLVGHSVGLVFIVARDDGDDGDVAVRGGEIVAVDVMKNEAMNTAWGKPTRVRADSTGQKREDAKYLKAARDHV